MDLKAISSGAIDRSATQLREMSDTLWKNPEVALEEHMAHDVLTGLLREHGFQVDEHHTMETAFRARAGGDQGVNVAVICEYDALPDIGHACGHNLIAEAGCAAAIGIKAALETNDVPLGRLTVFGTPAEEAVGGKVEMVNQGCFSDVDVAMMVHPIEDDFLDRYMLSMEEVFVTYRGKAAHAAAFPWEGVNALDAAVMAYTGVSMLRQQMKPSWRVHGVITKGGTKPNIIPEVAELEFYLRAPTDGELAVLEKKVEAIFRSASRATNCDVKITIGCHYSNIISNSVLIDAYEKNALPLGFKFKPPVWCGSTDMGNVSYAVPSIHPYFGVGTQASCHTREFTQATNTAFAHERAICAGKAMAMTAIDVLTCPELLEEIKVTFKKQVAAAKDCK